MNSLTKKDQKAIKLIMAYVQLSNSFDNGQQKSSDYFLQKKNLSINQNDNDKSLEEILESMWISKEQLRIKKEETYIQNNTYLSEENKNLNLSIGNQSEMNKTQLMKRNDTENLSNYLRIKQEKGGKLNQKQLYKQQLKQRIKFYCKECNRGYVQEHNYRKHIRTCHPQMKK